LVLAGAVLVGLQPWRDVERYSTGVGEQRVVMLSDGSRLSLNTGTRVQVEFSSAQRTVDVDGGEALFEVAKDAGRPFVVRAGGSEVLALGTVFSVRLSGRTADAGDSLAVTLVEGSVTVRAAAGVSHGLAPPQPVSLAAGDRVMLARTARAERETVLKLDRPRIDQVIAWKRDEAVFEDVALADAVAEMNRYSRRPLVLVEPVGSRGLRVSGLFKTGDSAGFARAVAALHGLAVREYADRLELVPN
jgi:transmembrane sensor